MSTKTTFKRIALVAVASLGFGMLSVAPSSAGDVQGTFAYGTLPTANVAAGGTFTVPVTWAATTTSTNSAGDKWIVKASVTGPTNAVIATPTADASTNALAAANTVAAAAGTGNTTTTGPSLTVTNVSAATVSATQIGTFSFVAPVAGAYTLTLTATVAQSDPAGTDAATVTVTDATLEVQVSGASLVQAESGLGATTGTQVTDRSAAAVFCVPAASTAASRYTVTATGATITGANSGADQADAVNAASYTSAAGIVQNTPNSYATGFTFEGQRTTNVASLAAGVNDCFIVRFTSATAGAGSVTARLVDPVTGVATSIGAATVTFGAAAAVSTSQSTVFIGAGNARPTVDAVILVPSTAGVALSSSATTGATIAIDVKDASGAALVNQAITATITGSGLITLANDSAGNGTGSTGTVRTASLTATTMASSSKAIIGVSADGTRGVGTITITAGGVTIATKTVTFHGSVATLTATQGTGVMRSGRTAASTEADFQLGGATANTAATDAITRLLTTNISIVAKDVDGNVVPLASNPTADISDASVIGAVNIVSCAGQAATTVCAAGAGNWIANTVSAIGGVSGASATVTFKTPHPTVAGTFISTAALPFSLGGTATGGTVTMTLDKATYEPGERMIITYTAKDSAGNPVRDWTAVGTPASNKAIVGLNGTGVYVAGKHIYGDGATELTYAPTAPGPFTLTLATGTSTTATITATATVADDAATTAAAAAGDAAAEATDAANAATDAANAAAEAADAATAAAQDAADAVAALSTSVTAMVDALKKQITSLTNLVIKIQKKVRA
jgi:hypothetical protein